jgi:prevent-host-death family protein
MRKYTTGEARDRFAEVVNEAAFGNNRVVLTRHGKDIAAVVPIADLEVFQELERLIDVEEAKRVLLEVKTTGGSISLEELKKNLEK